MKANEIMVGDYFRIAQTGKIIRIVAVDEPSGSVDYFDGDAGGVLTIGIEKIEPIHLTAEILEKNGFYLVQGDWRYQGFWIGLSHTSGESSICGKSMQFSWVHELQHVLGLCGIDKEIVLNE